MSNRVFIYSPSADLTLIHCMLEKGDHIETLNVKNMEELAQQKFPKSYQIVLLLPAKEIGFFHLNIPIKNKAKKLAAVAFELEDFICVRKNDIHYAVGPLGKDTLVSVAVIHKKTWEKYLSVFQKCGISLDVVCSSVFMLPHKENAWHISPVYQGFICRTTETGGFFTYTNNLLAFLSQETPENSPKKIIYSYHKEQQEIMEIGTSQIPQENQYIEEPLEHFYVKNFDTKNHINLLVKTNVLADLLRKIVKDWGIVFVFLALGILIHSIDLYSKKQNLSKEIEKTNQKLQQIFNSILPEEKRIIDVRTQINNKINSVQNDLSQQQNSFLGLFALFAERENQASNVRFEKIEYRDGSLILSIKTEQLENIENLIALLNQDSLLSARSDKVNVDKNIVSAFIVIRSRTP